MAPKLKLTGLNLGRVFNYRCGRASTQMSSCTSSKQSKLQWKTRPKQVLESLPLAFVLPTNGHIPCSFLSQISMVIHFLFIQFSRQIHCLILQSILDTCAWSSVRLAQSGTLQDKGTQNVSLGRGVSIVVELWAKEYKRGSITVPLTSGLTGLESAV